MIINLIKQLLSFVLDTIFSVIDIPVVPQELVDAVNFVFGYMKDGMSIVNFFLPLDTIAPGIDLIIVLFTVEHGYRLIMWILQKIPMLDIK